MYTRTSSSAVSAWERGTTTTQGEGLGRSSCAGLTMANVRRFVRVFRQSWGSLHVHQSSRSNTTVSYPIQLSWINANHDAIYQESLSNPDRFWGDLARRRLRWIREFDQVSDCDMRKGNISWFNGGILNVTGSYFVGIAWYNFPNNATLYTVILVFMDVLPQDEELCNYPRRLHHND